MFYTENMPSFILWYGGEKAIMKHKQHNWLLENKKRFQLKYFGCYETIMMLFVFCFFFLEKCLFSHKSWCEKCSVCLKIGFNVTLLGFRKYVSVWTDRLYSTLLTRSGKEDSLRIRDLQIMCMGLSSRQLFSLNFHSKWRKKKCMFYKKLIHQYPSFH